MRVARSLSTAFVAVIAAAAAACAGTPGEDNEAATSAAAATTAAAGATAGETAESTAGSTAAAGIETLGDVTLTFATAEDAPGPKASLDALAKSFKEKYPNVTVKLTYTAFDPYQKRVKLLAASDTPPDVFAGNQGYGTDGDLVKAGLIVPLDDYAEQFGWEDAFGSGTMQQFRWSTDGKQFGEGSVYGVGSAGEAVGLYYNDKKLKEAGVAAAPETLADFEAALEKVKAAGEMPLAYGNQDGWPGIHIWGSAQGQFADAASVRDGILGKEGATYDTPENLQAAQKIAEWVAKGYFPKNINGQPYQTAVDAFEKGTGAFMITGTWVGEQFEKNPDIHFTNLPVGASGKRVQTGSLSLPYHVSSKSKYPQVGAAFIDHIANKEAGPTLVGNGRVPAVPTDETPPSPLLAETIEGWNTLLEDDGLAFYPDWSTNTMYDTMTAGMQGLLGGNLKPEAYVKRLQSDLEKFQASRS